MQHGDRGFADVLTMSFPHEKGFERKRSTSRARFDELIVKAKESGRLRQEFTSGDLVVLLMANAGFVVGAGDSARVASQRLVTSLLAGWDTQPARELAPAPSPEAMSVAMLKGGCGGTRSARP
jgi:hypothetical protein